MKGKNDVYPRDLETIANIFGTAFVLKREVIGLENKNENEEYFGISASKYRVCGKTSVYCHFEVVDSTFLTFLFSFSLYLEGRS